jgi:Rrf2 family protein
MATLLRISEAAALALHAMGHLAVDPDGTMTAKALSRACGASDAHMIKVCQRLQRRGLLKARRGVGGGFHLARGAGRIRLYDVFVAIEGPIKLRPCLFRDRKCHGHGHRPCAFGKKVMEFETQFLRYLKGTTLARVALECGKEAAA